MVTLPLGVDAAGPGNDDFDAAVVVASIPSPHSQSTNNATLQPGEPQPCDMGTATVWYRYTPSSDEYVAINTTGSDFDTVLAVYTGPFDSLSLVDCNNDLLGTASHVEVTMLGGTTYQVQVGGLGDARGGVRLYLNPWSPVPIISDFSPRQGPRGTGVDVFGLNLDVVDSFHVDATSVPWEVVDRRHARIVIPGDADGGDAEFRAENQHGANGDCCFLVTDVPGAPYIDHFLPTDGPVGTYVHVHGTGLSALDWVSVAGRLVGWDTFGDDHIAFVIPATGGTRSLFFQLFNEAGDAFTCCFEVTGDTGPRIDLFDPTSGPSGTTVHAYGSGLGFLSHVFLGTSSVGWTTYDDAHIAFVVPLGVEPGGHEITVVGTDAEVVYVDGTQDDQVTVADVRVTRYGALAAGSWVKDPDGDLAGPLTDGAPGNMDVASWMAFDEDGDGVWSVNDRPYMDLDGDGLVSQFDVRVGQVPGEAYGSQVTSGDADIGLVLTLTGLYASLCYVDDDGSGDHDPGEAVYASGACGEVAGHDLRMTPVAGQPAGSTVRASHTDFGNPTSQLGPLGGDIDFVDADGDGELREAVARACCFVVATGGPPIIDSFDPVSGPSGTTVNVFGSGFATSYEVRFGGVVVPYTLYDDRQLSFVVPAFTSGPYDIEVFTESGGFGKCCFVITEGGGPPAIDFFDPSSGPGGTTVYVYGSGFSTADQMYFGGSGVAFTTHSDSQVSFIVPGFGPGGYSIEIYNPSGGAYVCCFEVTDSGGAPRIDFFDPPSGPTGTYVHLFGAGFDTLYDVWVNGFPLPWDHYGDDHIALTIPDWFTPGFYDFEVFNPAGSAFACCFEIMGNGTPPSIGSFDPDSGPPGTYVHVYGSGLGTLDAVYFGGGFVGWDTYDDAHIAFFVPDWACMGCAYDILVSNQFGSSETCCFLVAGTPDLAVHIVGVEKAPLRTDVGDVTPNPLGRHVITVDACNLGGGDITGGSLLLEAQAQAPGLEQSTFETIGDAELGPLGPGACQAFEFTWDALGTVGDVDIHAYGSPFEYDEDWANNEDVHEDFVLAGGFGGVILSP